MGKKRCLLNVYRGSFWRKWILGDVTKTFSIVRNHSGPTASPESTNVNACPVIPSGGWIIKFVRFFLWLASDHDFLRWEMSLLWSQKRNGHVVPFWWAQALFSCWAGEMAVSSPTMWWLHHPLPFSFCHSSSVVFLSCSLFSSLYFFLSSVFLASPSFSSSTSPRVGILT